MSPFPAIDPIPVPAPIWLLKLLHILTMALHFLAVQMVLGGLAVAVVVNVLGRTPGAKAATGGIAGRLPIVMTYVINLGVPPLLFAQVLYGSALYTSSVLIGAWWIAVIPLLMLCYWLLYQFSARIDAGRSAWWIGTAAWALAGFIGQIYSSNMTLMLRPEVWSAMYSASSAGTALPSGDPTLPARLIFMIGGGLTIAGLWMLWLSGRSGFTAGAQRFLASWGGRIALIAALLQAGLGLRVLSVQPPAVTGHLAHNDWRHGALYVWLSALAVVALLGLWMALRPLARSAAAWIAPVIALALVGAMTVYRDGIRDATLLLKGFDVWQRTVVTNWSVVGLFLVLFVAGLGAVGWLMSVVARAKSMSAKVASHV